MKNDKNPDDDAAAASSKASGNNDPVAPAENHVGKVGSAMAAAAAAAAKLFPGGSLGPAEDMDPTMAVILTNKVISVNKAKLGPFCTPR